MDIHACESDVSGIQENGRVLCSKLNENERIRGYITFSISGIPETLTSMDIASFLWVGEGDTGRLSLEDLGEIIQWKE